MSVRLIRSHLRHAVISLLCMTSVTGCGSDVKDTLGMTRVSPDEFRVVSRPPLTVPPQFSLRPPSVDANPPGMVPTTEQAKEMVLGGTQTGEIDNALAQRPSAQGSTDASNPISGNVTEADKRFLQQFGVTEADPTIRQQLIEERVTKQLVEEEESWWEVLSVKPKPKDPTVNAGKEYDRIQENKDAGKSVTEGETPVRESKDLGILGRIMGDE